jgi:hypothetical protein
MVNLVEAFGDVGIKDIVVQFAETRHPNSRLPASPADPVGMAGVPLWEFRWLFLTCH